MGTRSGSYSIPASHDPKYVGKHVRLRLDESAVFSDGRSLVDLLSWLCIQNFAGTALDLATSTLFETSNCTIFLN